MPALTFLENTFLWLSIFGSNQLLFLIAAFTLGLLTYWLIAMNRINQQQQKIEALKVRLADKKNNNPNNSTSPSLDHNQIQRKLASLEQAHEFLKRDYEMALGALESTRSQAEAMQKELYGSNILVEVEKTESFLMAKAKISNYLKHMASINKSNLHFELEQAQKIGETSLETLDQLDNNIVLAIAELIPESKSD